MCGFLVKMRALLKTFEVASKFSNHPILFLSRGSMALFKTKELYLKTK